MVAKTNTAAANNNLINLFIFSVPVLPLLLKPAPFVSWKGAESLAHGFFDLVHTCHVVGLDFLHTLFDLGLGAVDKHFTLHKRNDAPHGGGCLANFLLLAADDDQTCDSI